jgi:hypothetical protein
MLPPLLPPPQKISRWPFELDFYDGVDRIFRFGKRIDDEVLAEVDVA